MSRKDENSPLKRRDVSLETAGAGGSLTGPDVDFGAIRIPPVPPDEREKLCRAMESEVGISLAKLLSSSDLERYKLPGEAERDNELTARIFAALDRVILERAPALGFFLFYSTLVMDRLAQWRDYEPNGPDLYEKLGKALALGARARQGKAKLPVTPWTPQFKQEIQRELGSLNKLLRARVPSQPRRRTAKDWHDAVREIVHRQDCPFPWLLQNWPAFERFLGAEPEPFKQFCNGDLTPALFVNEWIARGLNRDPESTRQAISNFHKQDSK